MLTRCRTAVVASLVYAKSGCERFAESVSAELKTEMGSSHTLSMRCQVNSGLLTVFEL
jgi:hypothetical protein